MSAPVSDTFFSREPQFFDNYEGSSTPLGNRAAGPANLPAREPQSIRELFAEVIESRIGSGGRPVLVNDFLSTFWDHRVVSRVPFLMPFIYLSGMINFAFSVPIRASLVVITLLITLYHVGKNLATLQFRELGQDLKSDGLVFLGSLGEMCSNVLGLACPPLAYFLDECIQRNPTINSWYAQYAFTKWSRDFLPRETRIEIDPTPLPDDRGGYFRPEPRPIISPFSTPRPIDMDDIFDGEIEDYTDQIKPYFKEARRVLKQYIAKDELASMMPSVLNKIAMQGFLNLLSEEISLEMSILYVGDPVSKKSLQTAYDAFKKQSDLIVNEKILMETISNNSAFKLESDGDVLGIKQLARAMTFKMLVDDIEPDDVKDFYKNGLETQSSIEAQLEGLKHAQLEIDGETKSLNEAVDLCYTRFKHFVTALESIFREMFSELSQAAYE